MPTMPLNSSQPQRSFFWIWRTAATKLKAPLTKENAPNTKVMANRADCGIQNARAAKSMPRHRATQKPPILAQRTQCFGGVIRIGIGDGICVHAISPKDLYKIKIKHSWDKRGTLCAPSPAVSEQLGQLCLDFIEPAFSAASPAVFCLTFLSSAYSGSKSFFFP